MAANDTVAADAEANAILWQGNCLADGKAGYGLEYEDIKP